jgi:hypothetical protein
LPTATPAGSSTSPCVGANRATGSTDIGNLVGFGADHARVQRNLVATSAFAAILFDGVSNNVALLTS